MKIKQNTDDSTFTWLTICTFVEKTSCKQCTHTQIILDYENWNNLLIFLSFSFFAFYSATHSFATIFFRIYFFHSTLLKQKMRDGMTVKINFDYLHFRACAFFRLILIFKWKKEIEKTQRSRKKRIGYHIYTQFAIHAHTEIDYEIQKYQQMHKYFCSFFFHLHKSRSVATSSDIQIDKK